MTRRIFKQTGSLQPGRSAFDLSYEKKFTCDMGQLIPVLCDEAVPGDIWTIGNQTVIRFNPLVSPVLHEINMYLHVFFVPYRLLWDDWEDFISGGVDGDLVFATDLRKQQQDTLSLSSFTSTTFNSNSSVSFLGGSVWFGAGSDIVFDSNVFVSSALKNNSNTLIDAGNSFTSNAKDLVMKSVRDFDIQNTNCSLS